MKRFICRPISVADIGDIIKYETPSWREWTFSHQHYKNQIAVFPAGQRGIYLDGDKIVGNICTLRIHCPVIADIPENINKLLGYGDFETFSDTGNMHIFHRLTVADEFRKHGLGEELIKDIYRFSLTLTGVDTRCTYSKLSYGILGEGRPIEEYCAGQRDPAIKFHKRFGANLARIIPRGYPGDAPSGGVVGVMLYPNNLKL